MSELPEVPAGVEAEGMAQKASRGRPRNKPPIDSILSVVKGIEDELVTTGEIDYALVRKRLAAYMAVRLERTLLAKDSDMPMKAMADLIVRMAPIMVMFETMIPREGTKYPKTADAIDAETKARHTRMAKLIYKGIDPGLEAVLDAYAPAATQPPEEA